MKYIAIILMIINPGILFAQTISDDFDKGNSYYYGKNGVPKDYEKALFWYEKAANKGNAKAQCMLGNIYELGYGVKKNDAKAVEWYNKAAEQGNVYAQCRLGYMYEMGLGVLKDYYKALELYQKAAKSGDARAQCRLGNMYEMGLGVVVDYNTALDLYEKAAYRGNEKAQIKLASMYEKGKGVKQNYNKAFEWYQMSANQGNKDALFHLAYMYENGLGVHKNYDQADKLYKDAIEKGSKDARRYHMLLQSKIKSENNIAKANNSNNSIKDKTNEKYAKLLYVDTNIPESEVINTDIFAIILANEDYQHESKVDYAENDGKVFKMYCNQTLGIPDKNIHYVANATLNNIIRELDWIQQVCDAYNGKASVIFYYAGHGVPDESNGSAYLLPTDGTSRILRTCLNVDELYESLGKIPAKRITVLMDACFSGAIRNGNMLTSARGVAIKSKLGKPKGNMIVLSAAQGNETAYKYEEAHHGLFTYFLLKKLNETKGDVTIGELSNYITEEVRQHSIVINGRSQTPNTLVSISLQDIWRQLKIK